VLAPNTRLGPYRIVGPLGAGGMGEVYRAHDERLERDVAIKVLPPEMASSAEALARFEREAKAVAALSHPGILAVHDVGSENGVAYMVTELLEGKTLREQLAGEALSAPRAAAWGAEMADAVGAAHTRGIVHRDLKPENIFVTTDGRLKILDFGLARRHVIEQASDAPTAKLLTRAGTVLGTISYMSPEQVRGDVATPASDLFSLGVILNEMVSGMRPFDRQTAPDTMSAILRDEPRVAKSDLAPVIRRCLEKEPGRRFSSAKELGEALRARGASPVAHRISGWVFPAIVAVLIAAVALFSAREFRSHSAAPRHAIAVIPFGASEQEVYVSDGMTDAVIDALARVPKLRVMARSATERYRGGADPRKIADDLHVDALVTGRLRGNELDVELTAADGTHVWGSHYQADPAAPQQAQSRLIADLARQFGATAPRVRHSTDDPEAYRLYLRARYAWNKRDAASLRRSIDLYNQAIERDPSFALAYSGLADSWAVIGTFAEMPGSETFPKAKAAAMKAVELDDSIAEAHTSLAYAKHYWDHDWKGAEEEYRKAIALNPNYATAHQWYSELLTALGRFPQARQEIDRAIDLDPLSGIITSVKIWNLYMARDYAGAIAAGKQATSDFVEFGQAWAYLARAYSDGGDPRAAIATFDQAPKTASPIIEAWRAYAYAKAGQPAKTAEIAAKLEKLGTAMNPYYLAYPYAALGRKEEAIAALQRALEEHDEQLVWLKVDPALDSLRADPRFQKILTASRF